MSFADILDDLLDASGTRGVAFLDPHGQTIAQVGGHDALEVLGAYQSVWLAQVTRAAGRAGLGVVSDVSMDFHGARVLATEVKDGYFVLLVAGRDGLVSVARSRLDRVRARLAEEL